MATGDDLRLFIPITKIDEEKRLVYGTITEEVMDKSGEVFDYDSSKPHYEKWSNEIAKATDGKSVGNLRVMHGTKAAGKLTQLDMDDAEKRVSCVAKVVDDDEWNKCLEGVYSGFSHNGRCLKRWVEKGVRRYTVAPFEVSLVDNPCSPGSHFQVAKADGTTEEREFKQSESPLTEAAENPETVPADVSTEAPVADAETPDAEKVAASTTGDGKADYYVRKSALHYMNRHLEREIA